MKQLSRFFFLIFGLCESSLFINGCVTFNNICGTEKSQIVGETQKSLDIRPQTLRTREAEIGNLLTDAILNELPVPVDVAILPSYVFHTLSECGERQFISRGMIHLSDIEQVIQNSDNIVVFSITIEDLKRVLERSVSYLAQPDQLGQWEGFLQISQLLFNIDCREKAQTLTTDGKNILYPGSRIPNESIFIRGEQPRAGNNIKLATIAGIMQSHLGFVDLTPNKMIYDSNKKLKNVMIEYLQKKSPLSPHIEGRMIIHDSCMTNTQ